MRIVSLLLVLIFRSYIEALVAPSFRHRRSIVRATVGDDFDFSSFNPSVKSSRQKNTKATIKKEENILEAPKNETCLGIGGKNGISDDVNKLKTNLVQRCLASYKQQLWDELGNPNASQEAIEAMLASLVNRTMFRLRRIPTYWRGSGHLSFLVPKQRMF